MLLATFLQASYAFGGSKLEYDYFVDATSGKPFSILYESGPIRFMFQFPGHNPKDDFLYRKNFVAFLWISSKQPYSIRNLWFALKRGDTELIPVGNSFLNDKKKWKQDTSISLQTTPPRELDLDAEGEVLIGAEYTPVQLSGAATLDLVITFVLAGEQSPRRFQFSLRRMTTEEVIKNDPRFTERKPGEAILVGPWWLGSHGEDITVEYEAILAKAAWDPSAAIRLTGAGFLPQTTLRSGSLRRILHALRL